MTRVLSKKKEKVINTVHGGRGGEGKQRNDRAAPFALLFAVVYRGKFAHARWRTSRQTTNEQNYLRSLRRAHVRVYVGSFQCFSTLLLLLVVFFSLPLSLSRQRPHVLPREDVFFHLLVRADINESACSDL